MKTPSEPTPVLSSEDEADRLSALAEYHLVDTPPEEEFDRLVGLASRLFDVPIVLVSLVAGDRQFFKARLGLDVCETSREVSFCAHAILADDVFVIPDARQDPRFMSNPLVLGQPFIRFYAGKPLVTPAGRRIGTLWRGLTEARAASAAPSSPPPTTTLSVGSFTCYPTQASTLAQTALSTVAV